MELRLGDDFLSVLMPGPLWKEMLLARRVVNPPKIKNHRDTAAHIEKWQECRRKLEQEYGCKVEPGLQKAILI